MSQQNFFDKMSNLNLNEKSLKSKIIFEIERNIWIKIKIFEFEYKYMNMNKNLLTSIKVMNLNKIFLMTIKEIWDRTKKIVKVYKKCKNIWIRINS